MPVVAVLAPPLNHVFVDFENVQEFDVSILGTKSVCFTLLLGAKQTKLDASLVEKLMEHAASVQLVRLTSSGKNALDFALAYYVGRSVSANPAANIHIVSNDTGFDPLVDHLRARHIHAHRHGSFATLSFTDLSRTETAPAKAESAKEDLFGRVLNHLKKNVTNRPKKKKTLLSHLKSHLGKDATDADALGMLKKLQEAGHLAIDENDAVTYHV